MLQGEREVIGVLGIGMVVDNRVLFSPIGSSIVKQMIEAMLYPIHDDELWLVCSKRSKKEF